MRAWMAWSSEEDEPGFVLVFAVGLVLGGLRKMEELASVGAEEESGDWDEDEEEESPPPKKPPNAIFGLRGTGWLCF